ncbi:ATP-binding protein [Maribacter stanieri]|uniref:histidine kinase n=1 Tax=Maribacter stanieri TaxID=440514 RepID=A0A1I6JBN2_9FLAO|nr:ATP-binding protein [Maribacter stanieri]SFR76324.1 His Kinase A (phospho-acceptor) domain-containing protein [Maribacter stanieri]
MKPTKKREKEVIEIYDKWMYSYLNGDVETYDSYLDTNFHFIGSTDNEEFLNRKDTTKFFEATAEQLSGKSQIRNETKIVEQFGELIFITHLFDAWFLNVEEWNYYGRFRFSNILEQNEKSWHFVYQHYSTPDVKAQEGETIGFEQISKENLELREAIKRRTIELEIKNRELEIEGALERIRTKALAMNITDDLLDVVVTLRTEFVKLGYEAQYFWHMMWLPETYEKAMTSGDGSKIGFVMSLPRHLHGDIPLLADWEQSNNATVVYPMNAKAAISYVDKMMNLGDFKKIDPQAPTPDDITNIGGLTFIMARTSHGEIGYSLPGIVEHPPKENLQILVKFAKAFDLAHYRFLELQKSARQAREVQIELALEKVRSRTMAMQHSDELQEASFLLDEQVRALNIKTWGCAFNIYGENDSTEWFGNEAGILQTYKVPRAGIFNEYYKKGQRGESLVIKEFTGDECVAHYEYMSSLPIIGNVLKKLKETNNGFPTYQIDHVVYFKYGYLLFITREHVPDAHDIFKRFAKVFEQTYTRFLDLQKAEAQIREAQIENALERVRSRTMAMQRSDELPEAANDLFLQVQALGIPAWSAGYCIWSENKEKATAFMSSEGVIQKPFILPNIGVGYNFLKPSHNGETFHVEELGGELIKEHYEFMRTLPVFGEVLDGVLKAGHSLPTFQIFHICYFKHGYVMFITYERVPKFHDIFKRFATVFEQTYTRFLDLQIKENQATALLSEKKRLEITLSNLQTTQSQLIQAEKMASLGELTAGIAHEIQNPLNFVNNFSEVNNELIDEMNEELDKGDLEEAKAISLDIKQNLEKIYHHGKRADNIVKGMLQHSRSSSGTKEPTDINALADEYLRLAYHGLRAKDKSFNAELITDFDESIGKVNIVPQDMGRVILNLITNAFYAVNEKSKSDIEGYKPTVKITSKRTPLIGGVGGGSQSVQISISDNGNGIPKEIVEKIFQPFFTTKPTGQGTGLGLSMSYDIVTKGHGGELQVESKEGEGTTFIINLRIHD